jgi:tetratricopeptide (TPR) repeat protein
MSEHPFQPVLLDLLGQARLDQAAFVQKLSAAERAAIGTPEHWSAKDHVAHTTFWCQRLVLKLAAILRQETPPAAEDFELLNPQVFEKQRLRPWSEILSESEQAYDALVACVQQLGEEDLTSFNRFDWIPNQEPLYTVFMGNYYEHCQQHFAQYYLDRHDLPRATNIYETWANRVIQAESPTPLKGIVLYNLACFYATHAQLEQAGTTLSQALALAPFLKEFSLTDPDLIALRSSNRSE